MISTKWIYSLKKDELISYLEEFNVDSTGTVEELRKRLAQFTNKSGEDHKARLEELMLKLGRAVSPNLNFLGLDPTTGGSATSPTGAQPPTTSNYTWPKYATTTTSPCNTGAATGLTGTVPKLLHLTQPGLSTTEETIRGWYPPVPVSTEQLQNSVGLDGTLRQTDLAAVMDKVRKWSIKYTGGHGALSFIERLEEMADAYGINMNLIPRTLSELLQGSALVWYRCNKKPWASWQDFKTEFLEFFLPPRYFEHLEDTVRQRQQGPRESFKEYVIALQDLMHHVPYNAGQKLDRIFRNSRQEYQFHIKRGEFSNLAELLVLAGDYEAIKASIASVLAMRADWT